LTATLVRQLAVLVDASSAEDESDVSEAPFAPEGT
jgi:hypothetical protein